jgi:uncharacterized membrane protein YagU involved in acid resistance
MPKKTTHNPLKGALMGLIAGGAAGAVMDGYWAVVKNLPGARPEQKPKPGDDNQRKEQPSTQIIADKASEALTGREISKKNKPAAGVGVHYATSVGFGLPFGALAARHHSLGVVAGALYGAGIWLFFDEIALRALKIAPKPEKVPMSEHLQALGAHLVYGSATAALTRLLLR